MVVETAGQPPAALLAWLVDVLGSGTEIVATVDLSQADSRGPWRVQVRRDGDTRDLVLKAARPDDEERPRYATATAALQVAEQHDVPAPRPVAHDIAGECGWLTLVTTALPGTSRIPSRATSERLRGLGRAAAGIHGAAVSVSDVLPVRARTLDGYDLDAAGTRTPSTPLLSRAREFLASTPAPADPLGFVHGDLWQGNMLWDGDHYWGAIDWDFAGVGPAGIDLGSLRADVAVLHGVEAADEVLRGWEEAAGRPANNVAYWDVVAGVATPDDLGGWLPNFHAQGRTDLDLATVTTRRDRFLTDALARLR
ncbi:phosphotransferase enzyme family protein [Egicoccus sp. AB-alg2]|uniref:phosphotransferase enzyme family protein n=1 Tax=Egicoccus sp. AB-alg2 TaxID=3242693 RepID=UPI00359D01FD